MKTLPETNISTQKGTLEDDVPFPPGWIFVSSLEGIFGVQKFSVHFELSPANRRSRRIRPVRFPFGSSICLQARRWIPYGFTWPLNLVMIPGAFSIGNCMAFRAVGVFFVVIKKCSFFGAVTWGPLFFGVKSNGCLGWNFIHWDSFKWTFSGGDSGDWLWWLRF